MSAEADRLWLLKRLGPYGWTINLLTAKKWRQHEQSLVKSGLLERSDDGSMVHVTEAGRAAINGATKEAEG